MRNPTRGSLWLVAVVSLVAIAGATIAAPPENTDWGSITVEGDPVDAGFLGDGSLVYATTDADPTTTTETDCSTETGTADLFLVSFPGGPGCRQALDASGTEAGVQALATAEQADAAVVGLPGDGSSQLGTPNVVRYELSNGNLSQAWTETVDGVVLDVAIDDEGQRAAVAFQNADGEQRLVTYDARGEAQDRFRLPGEPRDLRFADGGRYLAAGGNFSEGGSSLGWANLYNLSLSQEENPVVDRTIPRPRAGIVASTAVTDGGGLHVGLLDGTVRWVRESGNDREVSLGTDPAHVDTDANGTVIFAAAGNVSGRLTAENGQLTVDWRTPVNGTSQDAIARLPHLFAVAETVNLLGPEGHRGWGTPAGAVVAANQTGLGFVVASSTGGSGPGEAATSVLEGRVLHRNATLDQAEPITVSPGGVSRANVTLENTGAAILNVTPTADEPGLHLTSEPDNILLVPGRPRQVSFTVHADRDASPGERSVPVDLQARPGLADDLRLDVEVTAAPNVTIDLAGGEVADRDVTQGQSVDVRLELQNRGNAETDVRLGLLQTVDEPWPATISPNATLTIPAGSATTARVQIDVPENAPNGTQNRVIVQGESEDTSAVQLNLTVNPFQVIRIQPDTVSQQMAPGETRTYDLSVENLGSVSADTQLRVQPLDGDGEPCIPTAWGVSLERSRVQIPAGESRDVQVEITAPAEIPVPEVENGTAGCTDDAQRPSLRVELHGRSDDGSADRSLLFANVDPSLAEETDENRQPFPGLTLLLAVLAGGATAVRGAKP